MKSQNIIPFLFLVLFSACGGLNKTIDRVSENGSEGIVFHKFEARLDQGIVNIFELDRSIVEGRVKEDVSDPLGLDHPVELVFIDSEGRRIRKSFIEHPLIRELEYPDEKGGIGRMTVVDSSSVFSLRYNSVKNLHGLTFKTIKNDTLPIQVKLIMKK